MAREIVAKEKVDTQLDVSKLEVGMVVKNYPTMCTLIGDEIKKCNSKKAQFKVWKQYFDWEPDGQKFIIVDVYDRPLPEMLHKSSIYAKFMQLSLMKYLSDKPDGCYNFFTNKLLKEVGMTGKKYNELREGVERYDELFGEERKSGEYVSLIGVKKTAEITYNRLLRILDDALKSMDNHGIIHYKREWAVKTTSWEEKGGFRAATQEEEKVIAKAEQEAMKEIGTTNKWFAYACKGANMGKLMSNYIHKVYPKLFGAAKWITIIYPNPSEVYWQRVVNKVIYDLKKDDPSIEMEHLTNQVVVELSKTKLNGLIVDAMMKEANKNIEQAYQQINKELKTGQLIKYNRDDIYYITSSKFMKEYVYLLNRYISIKNITRVEYRENCELDMLEDDLDLEGFDFKYIQ